MTGLRRFIRQQGGSSAAEFALVLPLALLFLFGIMDAGRYAWALNEYEKAVQTGARHAVVTQIVPQGLNEADFSGIDCGGHTTATGSQICQSALGTISCSKPNGTVGCQCLREPCPALGTPNSGAFDAVVTRMQVIAPGIDEKNVVIKYSGSGLGYVGDPSTSTMDVTAPLTDAAPLVTVDLAGLQFRPMSLVGFGVDLPNFTYTLTLEDGDGAAAY